MKINAEFNIDLEKERDMLEQVKVTLYGLQLLSPYKIDMEYVTNLDNTVTIRVKDFSLTTADLADMNAKSLAMLDKINMV